MAIDVIINQKHLQIQLKQLETVWHTVVNGYNLSQAAALLHTSQSSLSKQIAALENQLKADVFTRQGKRLTGLTVIGKSLLPHIEAIFAEINAYHTDIIEYANKKNVRIASPTTLISVLTVIQVIMTNMERDEAIMKFSRQLRGMGVDQALRERGAKDGDIVRIGKFEFEFVD